MSLPIILGSYAVSSGVVVDPTMGALVFGVVAWLLAAFGLVRGSRVLRRDTLLGVGIETRSGRGKARADHRPGLPDDLAS